MTFIQIIQVVVAIALIAAILMQNQGTGLSGAFGGSGNVFRTKRGVEKTLFVVTIVLAISFFALALLGIITKV